MITQEQTDKYIHNPNECPQCNSRDIVALTEDYSGNETNECYIHIECDSCNAKWIEVYTLTSIKEIKE